MKRSYFILAGACVFASGATLFAAELTEAKVTRLINEVSKAAPGASAQAAAIGDVIRPQWQVSTGDQSRTELTFNDLTLVRLGANTLFEFKPNEREVDLLNGTILLQVPKKRGGAEINTAPITAAVTGTTILCEYSAGPKGVSKWIVIEGQLRVTLRATPGESLVLNSGQMLAVRNEARRLPEPVDVDLERLLKTSKLINDGPFTIEEDERIAAAAQDQRDRKSRGVLLEVNFGLKDDLNPNTQVSSVVNAVQNRRDAQPQTQPPSPTAPRPQLPQPVVTPMPKPPPIPPVQIPKPIPQPTYRPPNANPDYP